MFIHFFFFFLANKMTKTDNLCLAQFNLMKTEAKIPLTDPPSLTGNQVMIEGRWDGRSSSAGGGSCFSRQECDWFKMWLRPSKTAVRLVLTGLLDHLGDQFFGNGCSGGRGRRRRKPAEEKKRVITCWAERGSVGINVPSSMLDQNLRLIFYTSTKPASSFIKKNGLLFCLREWNSPFSYKQLKVGFIKSSSSVTCWIIHVRTLWFLFFPIIMVKTTTKIVIMNRVSENSRI